MRWNPHVTVATVVSREEQFLCVKEHSRKGEVINQPAGHWEKGETLIEAAQRETLEETGWHVSISHLISVYQWQHPEKDETFLRFCFAANCLEHEPTRELDPAIISVCWLSYKQLLDARPAWRSPMVLRCIDDFISGRNHSLDLFESVLN